MLCRSISRARRSWRPLRLCARLPPAHACPCTRSRCTFGHLVFSRQPQKSIFYSRSAPFGRGSDSSSTESKQPPFRGSKYFATCYFSVIYYEHIFPFIRGFANSSESQNLAAASRRAAVPLLPLLCHFGGIQQGSSPSSPPGEEDVLQEPGITPCSSKSKGHLRWEIWFKQWRWVTYQSKEKFQ